jgi:hypothetical protein
MLTLTENLKSSVFESIFLQGYFSPPIKKNALKDKMMNSSATWPVLQKCQVLSSFGVSHHLLAYLGREEVPGVRPPPPPPFHLMIILKRLPKRVK